MDEWSAMRYSLDFLATHVLLCLHCMHRAFFKEKKSNPKWDLCLTLSRISVCPCVHVFAVCSLTPHCSLENYTCTDEMRVRNALVMLSWEVDDDDDETILYQSHFILQR